MNLNFHFETNFCIEPLLEDWLEGLQTVIKEQENLVATNDEFYMPFVGNC